MNAPAASAPIRILVVEDHLLVRQGIVSLLQMHADFVVVGEAADGAEAERIFRAQRPDVTLVDLRIPGPSGADLIAKLRAAAPGSRFVVVTTFSGEEDVTHALRAGADGYLLKGMSRRVLEDAIRAVHAGQRYIPPEIALRAAPRPDVDALTARERDVLTLIGQGLGNGEIAGHLGIAERTVKGHVNSLFSKLGVADRTAALVTGIRRGLVSVD